VQTGTPRSTPNTMRQAGRSSGQDFVEFQPSHLPILVTNHLPRVSGDDPAVWARIRVIPFDVVIPDAEQDKHLDAKLQLEADGILAWAVEGWRDYRERGLAEPDSVRIATDNYQADSDPIGRFIEECCDTGVMFSATTKPLYEKWQRWQESDGTAEPMGRRTFGEALDRRGYHAGPPSDGKRIRRGIALKQDQGASADDD
jgi:putative DNA primase/helicase